MPDGGRIVGLEINSAHVVILEEFGGPSGFVDNLLIVLRGSFFFIFLKSHLHDPIWNGGSLLMLKSGAHLLGFGENLVQCDFD